MPTKRRGAPRGHAPAVAYRCDAFGHPLTDKLQCKECGGSWVEWTSAMDRDYHRVVIAAEDIRRSLRSGRPLLTLDQLPEVYDHERWPDTTPADMALMVSYYMRWQRDPTVEDQRRFVHPVKPQFADRWYVDCECGERFYTLAGYPDSKEGPIDPLLSHLFDVAMKASVGSRPWASVPGHTTPRDARSATVRGRENIIRMDRENPIPGRELVFVDD